MLPPRSILAAVDFSEPSRVALACAARLANSCGAALHLLHAEDPLLGAAARARGLDLSREARDELARFVRSAAPAADLTPVPHVIAGRPIDVVCDIAHRERVDLIVIGSRGMSVSEHVLFGSTTEGVLVRADVSVLVVPATWTAPRPESDDLAGAGPLVAAIECTTPALAAAGAACRLAKVLATSVQAVHVVPSLGVIERWQGHADRACEQGIDEARRELALVLPELRAEVPLHLRIESGSVADRLAASAAQAGPHAMLILGRRSPGSKRGAPGDIARRVLAQTGAPVLVYLPDERSAVA
jgi:nucleotide-binding universal stress UspA family protein